MSVSHPIASRQVRGAAQLLVFGIFDFDFGGGGGVGIGVEKVDGDLVVSAAQHSRVTGAAARGWGRGQGNVDGVSKSIAQYSREGSR